MEDEYHWNLYWHQQKLMDKKIIPSEKIAEIGVGSKFTYNYLKSKNYSVTSIDIDPDKNPDILLNIVDCDAEQLDYNVIIAFNIFEHIPYSEFLTTIKKFNIAGIEKLFFSIPLNKKTVFEFKIRIGRYLYKEIATDIRKHKITTEHHHWELDYKGYTKEKLGTDLFERNYVMKNYFIIKNQAYFFFSKNK